jgi:hypothetical protein
MVKPMNRVITLTAGLAMLAACSNAPAANDAGAPNQFASSAPAGDARAVPTMGTGSAPASNPSVATSPAAPAPEFRDVTLPAGTVLPVDLETAVGSDTSQVEQPVQGRLRRAVTIDGVEALPAGTAVSGHVTAARRPGRVKGRSYIALRFTQLDTPGEGTTRISTAAIARQGRATKEKDTLKVVAPAAAGAVIGRIAGGKDAAAKGAVIGGAGGAGYVLATRGEDVRLAKGTDLSVKLTAPVTVRVPVR